MKKKFLPITLTIAMTISNVVPMSAAETSSNDAIDLTENLIAEYLFNGDWKDSISSKVVTNYSAWGNYWLESDSEHDANPNTHPGPMLVSDNIRGNVVEMNGMWNNTGYLSFDTSYLQELTDSFSVTMWAKGNNSKTENNNCTDSMSIFNVRTKETVSTEAGSYGFVSLDTSLYPFINDGAGNYKDRTTTDLALSTTDWMQVTMVIDSKNNCINTYVDGSLKESAALGGGTVSALMESIKNGYALQIGSYTPWWAVWDFRGYVDDVRFYNKVLSADEVAALYSVPADQSLIDTSDVTNDVKTYAQYKKVGDTYTVRLIAEVEIPEITAFNQVGFRCSKSNTGAGEDYLGTKIFKSVKANGKTITAAENKYFVVLEIENVTKDAKLYAQAISQAGTAMGTFGNEVTVNMENIIK